MDKPENPPAFPLQELRSGFDEQPPLLPGKAHLGLTIRDFFAAAALQGCVEKQFSDALLAKLGSTEMAAAAMASAAYEVADACLVARTKGVDPMFAAIEQRDALRQTMLVVAGRLSALAGLELDGAVPQGRDLARLADELVRVANARKESQL
jgi:hypothetical protein